MFWRVEGEHGEWQPFILMCKLHLEDGDSKVTIEKKKVIGYHRCCCWKERIKRGYSSMDIEWFPH